MTRSSYAGCVLLMMSLCAPASGGAQPASAGGEPSCAALVAAAWAAVDSVYYDAGFRGVDWASARDEWTTSLCPSTPPREAVRSFLSVLEDPAVRLIPADAVPGFMEEFLGNSHVGIGLRELLSVDVDERSGLLTVVTPVPDSPADGPLRTGDVLESIDGIRADTMDLARAVQRLRGDPGTRVALTVRRQREVFSLELERTRVELSPPALVRAAGDDVPPVLRVHHFGPGTGARVAELLDGLEDAPGLILDLRQNPGGLLNELLEVAELLLPAATPVARLRSRPERDTTFMTGGPAGFDGPLAVLIDEGTASAAEALAGAVQAAGRGPLVGRRTFGKGLAHFASPLPDGSLVLAPIGRLETPHGRDVLAEGLVPDVAVPARARAARASGDPMLSAARRALREPGGPEVVAVPIAGGVHRLDGAVDNIVVWPGPDGLLMIDSGYDFAADGIRRQLLALGGRDVPDLLINTHHHHAFANHEYAGPETRLIAHEAADRRMRGTVLMGGTLLRPFAEAALPNDTFGDSLTLRFNGSEIRLIHLAAAHTDNDVAVWLEGPNVLVTGDVFVPHQPWISVDAGATVEGLLAGLDRLIARVPPDARVVPGHDPVTASVDDIRAFRAMIAESADSVRARIDRGLRLTAVQQAGLPEHLSRWEGEAISQEFFLESLYRALVPVRPNRGVAGTAFVGGRWFRDGRFEPDTMYSVDGVLRSDPPARVDRTVDLGGGYVVPPFADAHTHRLSDPATLDRDHADFLSQGVFYAMVQDAIVELGNRQRELSAAVEGVDIAYTRGVITPRGGTIARFYQSMAESGAYGDGVAVEHLDGQQFVSLDSVEDVARRWPEIERSNDRFLKVILAFSDQREERLADPERYGMDLPRSTALPGLAPEVLAEVVRRAHQAGLEVSAHVETAADFRLAVEAGVDWIAHLPASWQVGAGTGFAEGVDDPWLLRPEDAFAARAAGIPTVTTTAPWAPEDDRQAAFDRIHAANLRTLRDAGAPIAVGSDLFTGSSVDEVLHLRQLDVFTDAELLTLLAVYTPRMIFPERRIGHLRDGYEASFLVLDADPTVDLAAITRVRMAVKRGLSLPVRRPGAPSDSAVSVGLLFADDFEDGLSGWRFPFGQGDVVESGDPARGRVLSLRTGGVPVYALIRGSDRWTGVRMTGRMMFPDPGHSYLGFIYRYVDDGRRVDFGSVYVKGNGSYIQANPHFDTNVGRTLYPEARVSLTGGSAVRIGEWQDWTLEVIGGVAHLYVGDTSVPNLTFRFGAGDRGAFGLKPRNPGERVWIDDLVVSRIRDFTYRGPPRPDVPYESAGRVRHWDLLGPLSSMRPDVERSPFDADLEVQDGGDLVKWRAHEADPRGAVVTSAVTDFRGPRRVAYLHAELESRAGGPATLEFSTVDPLAIWLNGEFIGFGPPQEAAWWDARTGGEHQPIQAPVRLRPGVNHLLVRVVGGTYASGGFYLRVRPDPRE